MIRSSLRSHFFKHVPCTTTTTLLFAVPVPHIHHHVNPRASLPTLFSPLPSPTTTAPAKQRFSSITLRKASTTAFPDIPGTSAFTSPYLSAQIRCRKDVADMLSEALLCFGASSTSMDVQDDENDDEVCISSIFSDYQDVDECISHAMESIGLKQRPSYEVIKGDHSDWIEKSQDLQATNIILNPGLAFGTGEHPTTKLCLLLLHSLIKGGELFLDYGTGSGVLAIAAIKFGAALSVGFDIDPQAITAARQNASLNKVGAEKLQVHLLPSEKCHLDSFDTGVISETKKYDVVIANILLNRLLDLADHIVSYAKPGAVVGVSGIISEQIPCIFEQYSQFLNGISVSKMDDWACISGIKKADLNGS